MYVGVDATAEGVAAAARLLKPCFTMVAAMLVDDVLVLRLSNESLSVTVNVAEVPAVARVIVEPDAYEKLEQVTPGSTVVTTLGDAWPALE